MKAEGVDVVQKQQVHPRIHVINALVRGPHSCKPAFLVVIYEMVRDMVSLCSSPWKSIPFPKPKPDQAIHQLPPFTMATVSDSAVLMAERLVVAFKHSLFIHARII